MRFNRELIVWRDVLKIGSLCVTENVCPLAFVLLRVQIPSSLHAWLPGIPNSIIETVQVRERALDGRGRKYPKRRGLSRLAQRRGTVCLKLCAAIQLRDEFRRLYRVV